MVVFGQLTILYADILQKEKQKWLLFFPLTAAHYQGAHSVGEDPQLQSRKWAAGQGQQVLVEQLNQWKKLDSKSIHFLPRFTLYYLPFK